MQKVFEFMFNKRNLPVIILIVLAGVFITFQSIGSGNPPSKYEKILRQIGLMLEQGHYSPQKMDDEFSKKVFDQFLETIDSERQLFLLDDVNALRTQYGTKIDDEIHGAPLQSFPGIYEVYSKRLKEYLDAYDDILAKPFDFTIDEIIVRDKDKMQFPKTTDERADLWRKKFKYETLVRYADLLSANEKVKDKKESKTNQQLEKDARERVKQFAERNAEKLKVKYNEEFWFNQFVNVITSVQDPHTTFFPPIEKRSFDENMSGRFYGIGASLRQEDGGIKIVSLVTGSPAWKSGEIQIGDIISKVGQSDEEPQDMAGYDTEDAVKVIRGKKGTVVKLTLKKVDGTTKVVKLVRDEIVVDETFARSAIVNDGGYKMGYIFLPEFYADWERPNGAKCSEDVAREIQKLKAENVEGIIMDLRNNGGGSLFDVIQMVGLFIDEGPVVQVRDRAGNPTILRDKDKGVLYDGPLVVMVNEFSASASEIFAAAIQDYKRGIVVGSTSTFGKGTVQRQISLDGNNNLFSRDDAASLGAVKLTLQKFYRINGGSTQLRGVTPDVVIPDQFEFLDFREKDNPLAMPWDEISQAKYSTWSNGNDITYISKEAEKNILNNPVFEKIKSNTELLSKLNDKTFTLSLKKHQEEQKKITDIVNEIKTLVKSDKENQVTVLNADANKYKNETEKEERRQAWLKDLKSDIYLGETVNIMNNIISKNAIVRSK